MADTKFESMTLFLFLEIKLSIPMGLKLICLEMQKHIKTW